MADINPEKRATDDLQIEQGPVSTGNLQDASLDDKALNIGAIAGTEAEHSYGVWQGLKTYKRAALWSIAISSTIIMEGYDVTLIGNFYGYPAFRERYGVWTGETDGWQIESTWQQKFNILGSVMNIVGALLNGWATPKWGHRKVLIVSLIWLTCFIFLNFFAQNIEMQLAGQTLCNIPWGVFATTPPAYAAEITPLAIRPYLTAYINLCWAIGQLISQGVLAGLVDLEGQWSYRIPFGLQWIWPVPLMLLTYFAPESPWYLVRTGQLEKAKKSLTRLSEPSHDVDLDATLAMMVHTDKVEKQEQEGVQLWDCFKGTNLRRTEIACMSFLSQITNGGALCYSATFFYTNLGLKPDVAYNIGVGGQAVALVGTMISWLYIHRFGRRIIWLVGFGSLVLILWTIGFLAIVPGQARPLQWAQAMLCVVWLGSYSMSVGPIVYTIVAEIGSTRLRTQTVVLGRSLYYAGNIIGNGTLQPEMMSPTAWNLRGKTAFFWAGTATLTFIWGYFRLFETRGRTFGEMDYMFQHGISARKSKGYVIDESDQFAVNADGERTEHITTEVKS